MSIFGTLLLAVAMTGTSAKISSENRYLDRDKGFIYFSGKVHIADVKYELHSDRAYVFPAKDGGVERIVALGDVVMTNKAIRAYGGKLSYFVENGVVDVHAADGGEALVRRESKRNPQEARGLKVRFNVKTREIDVVEKSKNEKLKK